MDWDQIIQAMPFIMKGLGNTIKATFVCVLYGLILGFILAYLTRRKDTIIYRLVTMFTSAIRSLPELLFIYIVYFGGGALIGFFLDEKFYDLGALKAGVIALGTSFAAYASEVIRGAIKMVPREEIEAGKAYGMSPMQIFFRITIPQAIFHAIPGIGNLALVLLKDTSLLSLIELTELMRSTRILISRTRLPLDFLLTAAGLYLILTLAIIGLFYWLQRQQVWRKPQRVVS